MNLLLFTALLRVITRLLPSDRQERYLNQWLADYDVAPRPFWSALSFLPAAFRMRAPFEVKPEDVTPIHLLDRLLLAQGQLVWGFVAFTFVTYLLFLLAFNGWSQDSLRWLAGAGMFLIYAGGLIRTGLGVDLPWLRMTRAGSLIQFCLGIGALVTIGLEPPQWLGSTALLVLFTLWTWTGYWGVRRPLKKRGFLSR